MSDNLQKTRDIIKTSGNNFHSKVVKYFQDRGWTVQISPYYTDTFSNKPREIDIIAEKAFEFRDRFHTDKGTINVQLLLECKYINGINVFWFHTKDQFKASKLVKKILKLHDDNMYVEEFHYMAGHEKVAKFFASQKGKATENEPFFKAINQTLNAYLFFRSGKTIIQSKRDQSPYISRFVRYPVIICNNFDMLFKTEMGQQADPEKIRENFLLEIQYAYIKPGGSSQTEYFLIDVVDFDQLDKFLENINNDVKIINFLTASRG